MSNELQLTTGPYRFTAVGMEVVRKSTKPEWKVTGENLRRLDEAKQWAIGDWLVDGKSHYGDGLYAEAAKLLGIGENELSRARRIAEQFEIRQRCLISYGHHYEVASLKTLATDKKGKLHRTDDHDMEKAQELLAKAVKEPWSVRELRAAVAEHVRRQDEKIRLANEPERYDLILADPAWLYEFSETDSREIDNQYTPTSLEEMKTLKPPAASDCALFMWATSPKLAEAMELMTAWDFDYRTCMVWVKDKIGMGYVWRQRHELLLYGARGSPRVPEESERPDSVLESPRREHSQKPDEVYGMLESMYPRSKKLEMFARGKRKGWDSWGDEVADSP